MTTARKHPDEQTNQTGDPASVPVEPAATMAERVETTLAGSDKKAGHEITTGWRKWAGLGVLAFGLSMIVIDGTIVGVALPTIISDLGLDLTQAQWVNSIYSVIFAALLLTTGRLGDRLGRRRLFIFGVIVFVGGSLLAASARSSESLIFARFIQGIGGAFVLPSTLSSVNATFRGRDRVIAFAVWGSVISGMAAIGPLLGGWLTTSFSWPWIFWVNLPIGVLVIAGALLIVPETRARNELPGLDVSGLLLSAIGFGALIFALVEGAQLGWWAPKEKFSLFGLHWPVGAPISVVPVCIVVGLLALIAFVGWERHRARAHRSAILDLNLFRIRTFSWGNTTALMVAIGEFGLLFVLPLFLVNVLGLSTLQAGFVLAAMAAGAFLSGAAARHLADRFGPTGVVMLGLALEVVGVVIVALVAGRTLSPLLIAPLLAIYGAGLGLASAQLTGTVLRDIPTEQSGQGSATQSTVRQLGAALGTALLGTVLSISLAATLPTSLAKVTGLPGQLADQLARTTRASGGGTIPGLRAQGASGQLGGLGPKVVDALSDAFSDSTRVAMLVAAAFLLIGLIAASQVSRVAKRKHRTQENQ